MVTMSVHKTDSADRSTTASHVVIAILYGHDSNSSGLDNFRFKITKYDVKRLNIATIKLLQ